MDWYPSLIVKFRVNFLWVRWRRADFLFQRAETIGRARSTDIRDRKVCENFGRRDSVCGAADRKAQNETRAGRCRHLRRISGPGAMRNFCQRRSAVLLTRFTAASTRSRDLSIFFTIPRPFSLVISKERCGFWCLESCSEPQSSSEPRRRCRARQLRNLCGPDEALLLSNAGTGRATPA